MHNRQELKALAASPQRPPRCARHRVLPSALFAPPQAQQEEARQEDLSESAKQAEALDPMRGPSPHPNLHRPLLLPPPLLLLRRRSSSRERASLASQAGACTRG
jgi:hypothetical protein